MRRATFKISLELLESLLNLPENVKLEKVLQANNTDYTNRQATVIVNGDGLPKDFEWRESQYPKEVYPIVDGTDYCSECERAKQITTTFEVLTNV